jgi:hypothetical protein
MANRFTPPRPPTSSQEIRSQLALELMLNGYAVGGALIIFRALLKSLEVDRHLWVGAAIYGVTDLVERPVTLLPGAGTLVFGELSLADATLVALVVLFPLGLLVVGNRRRNSSAK